MSYGQTPNHNEAGPTPLGIVQNEIPELSFPFSGLPLEYIVANLPSSMKRNQPFEPFDSSNAAESDQTYKQSRPRQMFQSCQ